MEENDSSTYDMKLHIPQQMENLFNLYSSGNSEGFSHVLTAVEKIMRDDNVFLMGLSEDKQKLDNNIKELLKQSRIGVLKALEDKNDELAMSTIKLVVSRLEENYTEVIRGYMMDVVDTCTTYFSQKDEELDG